MLSTSIKRVILVSAVALLTLSGCANIQSIQDTNKQTGSVEAKADAYVHQAGLNDQEGPNVVIHHNGFYVPLTAVPRVHPESQALKCPFGFNPPKPATLDQLAKRITDACNISVRITPDAQMLLNGGFARRATASTSAGNGSSPGSVPPPPVNALTGGAQTFGLNGVQGGGIADQHNTISMNYDGTVGGALDAATGQLGLSYRYDDPSRTATVFYTETRTFTIGAIVSDSTTTSSVEAGSNTAGGSSGGSGGSGGGGGGSGGGISSNNTSAATAGVTSVASTSKDIKASVDAMLTPGVGTDSPVSPSTGTITVTDTPQSLDRIGGVLGDFNKIMMKQMRFNVQLITFTGSDSADASINMDALYTDLAKNFNIGLSNTFQAPTGSTSATINILQGNSHWSTSQAVLNALNAQGHATNDTQTPVSTLNLQSASVQIAENEFYLASSSVTGGTTTGSASQASLQPGSFTVGYNLQMLPYAMPDESQIILQFSLNLSSLKQLRTITSNGSQIEAPDINMQLLQQKVRLKVGQTLILTGFQQKALSVSKQGTGLPGFLNYVLGGGASTDNSKQSLVVLVTPAAED